MSLKVSNVKSNVVFFLVSNRSILKISSFPLKSCNSCLHRINKGLLFIDNDKLEITITCRSEESAQIILTVNKVQLTTRDQSVLETCYFDKKHKQLSNPYRAAGIRVFSGSRSYFSVGSKREAVHCIERSRSPIGCIS